MSNMASFIPVDARGCIRCFLRGIEQNIEQPLPLKTALINTSSQ